MKGEEHHDKLQITWDEMFTRIAPDLIVPRDGWHIRRKINTMILAKTSKKLEELYPGQKVEQVNVTTKDFDLIRIQFRALKLINVTDDGSGWTLTPYGDNYMTKLIAIRNV